MLVIRHGFILAVAVIVAMTGAVSMAPCRAETTSLVMGGTAQPTPSDWAMVNALDGILAGTTLVPVTTPAQWWPFVGTLPLSDSIAAGQTILIDAITSTEGPIIVFGYSQSAYIASLVAQDLATTSDPPARDRLTFILTANPGRPGGFLTALPAGITVLGATFTGGVQPVGPYDVIDVAYEYDAIARFPTHPENLVADLNAILGAVYVHGAYSQVNLADIPESDVTRVVNEAGGVTTYYLVRQPDLPLLQPLRDLGVDRNLMNALNTALTPVVKAGYDAESNSPTRGPVAKPPKSSALRVPSARRAQSAPDRTSHVTPAPRATKPKFAARSTVPTGPRSGLISRPGPRPRKLGPRPRKPVAVPESAHAPPDPVPTSDASGGT